MHAVKAQFERNPEWIIEQLKYFGFPSTLFQVQGAMKPQVVVFPLIVGIVKSCAFLFGPRRDQTFGDLRNVTVKTSHEIKLNVVQVDKSGIICNSRCLSTVDQAKVTQSIQRQIDFQFVLFQKS